jgi:hypothetical protein
MQALFNQRLRPDCNIYPPTETPSARIRIPRQRGAVSSAAALASDRDS